MRKLVFSLCLVLCLAAPPGRAADGWTFEAYGGDAFNFRTRLSIEQQGGYSRSLEADYETRGFRTPPLYHLRAARWQDGRAWEISLIHHKIYLKNPPSGVANLSISHGFNIVSLNRAFRSSDWVYRLGAGPVVTHAEATINGTTYDGPYRLSGAAALASAGRRLRLGERVFVALEGALLLGYASPRFEGTPDAKLRATNLSVHGLLGLGYEF